MWVIVPYVTEHPEVRAAIEATGWFGRIKTQWQYVGNSDRDYFDALAALWTAGESFTIVEQDIVIHAGALDELADCPHDWCSFPFAYGNTVTHGLGCVKFSAGLIARNPDAMRKVAVMHDGQHGPRHWCRLDAWLTCVLEGAGEVRHKHETMVRHLDPCCSHGCTPNM